jgi:hypothetical protein
MGTKWIVRVDDNFHYGDEDERYRYGGYDDYDEAVAACRKIVDEYLDSASADTAEAWCPQRDSNSRPSDYKSDALPAEL